MIKLELIGLYLMMLENKKLRDQQDAQKIIENLKKIAVTPPTEINPVITPWVYPSDNSNNPPWITYTDTVINRNGVTFSNSQNNYIHSLAGG